MLSPPSSSNGDMTEVVDCDTLFPELDDIEIRLPFSLNNYDLDDNTTISDATPDDTSNVVTVKVMQGVSKSEPTATMFHHNYASLSNINVNRMDRLPKYAELEPDTGFAVCGPMSKNAVLARENRRKKKEYISTLEQEIDALKCEKSAIASSLSKANIDITDLHQEIDYLKSVIANETVIGSLLKNIPNSSAVNIKRGRSTSKANDDNIASKRRKMDHSYGSSGKSRPGVCLHVSEGSVSLEFCKKCNDGSKKDHLT